MSKNQNTTTTLKLSFNNEVFKVLKPENLSALHKIVKDTFPQISKSVALKYDDYEGDLIVIATEEDYQSALVFSENEGKTLKVFISENGNHEVEAEAKKTSKRDEVIIEEENVEQPKEETLPNKEENENVRKSQEIPREKEEVKGDQVQDAFKDITLNTLFGQLPNIALIVKELLEGNSPSPQQVPQENGNKAVHHGVSCDVCGVSPIVGYRYKCTVLNDYDLCEGCEAKAEHPYPLLKLKNESQKSVKVSTVLHPNKDASHSDAHNNASFRNQQQPRHFGLGFPAGFGPGFPTGFGPGFPAGFGPGFPAGFGPGFPAGFGPQCQGFQNLFGNLSQHFPAGCGTGFPGGLGPQCQEFQNLFGNLSQHFSKPEEAEKLSNALKNGFGAFQEIFNDFKTQFEKSNAGQTQTKENSKEESKEPNNANDKNTQSHIEDKSSKKSQNDFNFVGQLCQNLFSDVIKNFEHCSKPEKPAEEKIGGQEYSTDIVKKAKAIVEIFPQSTVEDVCEIIKHAPSKSVDQLIQDYF